MQSGKCTRAGDATTALELTPSVGLYVSAAALAAPEYIDEPSDGGTHDVASAPSDSSDESWIEGESEDDTDVGGVASKAGAVSGITTATARLNVEVRGADAHTDAAAIVAGDACRDKCIRGKEKQIENFLKSLWQLNSAQWKVSLMTAIAVLREADTAVRSRGTGAQERFHYYLPLVGRVCREVFCRSFGVSAPTVARYKATVRDGSFAPRIHGGAGNTNATSVDLHWLVLWFLDVAAKFGDVVPVRVRKQKTMEGRVIRHFSPKDFTLLPAHFTWRKLHAEMESFAKENTLDVRTPAQSTMRKLLQAHCPLVKIRSPRSNVRDICSIYINQMGTQAASDTAEIFGRHTEAARRMRHEYNNDLKDADEMHAVIIMDYSQNLTIPSISNQPASWYFLSLWSVSVFGIYCGNDGIQTNYIYDERTAGKGSDEVNSLLMSYLRTNLVTCGFTKVTIYADNCTGQNKNNYVVKMLLALVHMGEFEEINLKLFIKGHTKNAVDRGFAHIRKKVAKEDVWTMNQLLGVVDSASTSDRTVHVELGSKKFKSFKSVLNELYKDTPGILKYQLFRMRQAKPGVIECRVEPDETPTEFFLSRKIDGLPSDALKVQAMLDIHLPMMMPPTPNAEKITQMYEKVRPFVPLKSQQDIYYHPPTQNQHQEA